MASDDFKKLAVQSKQQQNRLNTEAAEDVTVNHEKVDMGSLTSRQIGNLVKYMVVEQEQKMK